MKFTKKLLAIMLTAVLVLGLFTGVMARAAENGIPKISLKYVNSKTGVKITIGKTAGAEGYIVYLKGYGDSYSNYWSDEAKNKWWRQVAEISKDGSTKHTYTITGLPKGTYQIKVAARKTFIETSIRGNGEDTRVLVDRLVDSDVKTVKIKAPKAVKTEEKTYEFPKTKVGDIIIFGSYEQDGSMTNGKEDIEWIVLSKTKSQMLVISKYALDCLSYNNEEKDITWENCTLRKWLNNSFYKAAFTKAERNMIKKMKLENADNPEYGTEGGNATKDNVFLLSLDDVLNKKYGFDNDHFINDIARRCAPTTYALIQGVWDDSDYNHQQTTEGKYSCCWWLRSPGDGNAAYVHHGGEIRYGEDGETYSYAVRPAIVISLQ